MNAIPTYRIHSVSKKNKKLAEYQLKQTLGKGGFAKVKRATHVKTKQDVAVKIINITNYNDEMMRRIRNEIQIHKKLIHQNIVRIFQVIQDGNYIYIFMELCPLGQLFKHINQNGPMSEEEAFKIFTQLIQTCIYLHQMKICHRDIKAQNVLLDYKMNIKLTDFGLSKHYDSEQDIKFKTFCGSPGYNSPEMIWLKPYDPQLVDVWSLGVTLYAMLSAELPFGSNNKHETSRRITEFIYPNNHLSFEVRKLLKQIFTTQNKRIRLQDIKQTEYYIKYHAKYNWNPNFVNTVIDDTPIDQQILNQIQRLHGIQKQQVIESVLKFKMDSKYALYYLTMQANYNKGNESPVDIKSKQFHRKTKTYSPHKNGFLLVPVQNKGSKKSRASSKKSQISQISHSTKNQIKSLRAHERKSHNNVRKGQQTFRAKKFAMQIIPKRLLRSDSSPDSPTKQIIQKQDPQIKPTKEI